MKRRRKITFEEIETGNIGRKAYLPSESLADNQLGNCLLQEKSGGCQKEKGKREKRGMNDRKN